ncbi:uncharacterized protein LOC131874389 [Cryptomeria japonica]|uniref:uncharacterized protein LOC131874389 n=1 Tax=Cryptomeria japonica TaxID=3369 RepID=UPI0027DA6B30|nr:uncharacterized protein LOC131874389 [Cryptomeria japonica]
MGYEVDGNTLDTYAQHLLSISVDEKEERFGTYKEESLDLHKKLTKIERKRKVKKEVEELAEKMSITKEVIQKARDNNILKEEDMKPVPPPKPQTKSTGGDEKRKKGKTQREYVAVTIEEETKSNEAVKEVKKTTTYARVVKKPQSGGAQLSKKPRTKAEPSGRARLRKKPKYELHKALKSSKVEGTYTIVPPMTLSEIVDEVVEVDRMLKIAKDRLRIEKRVNKIMLGKIDEVVKETKIILKQFLQEHIYEVNPKDQSIEQTILKGKTNEHTTVVDDQNVGISDEAGQNPPMIEVYLEKATEEIGDGKGEVYVGKEVDDEKEEVAKEDENAKVVEKENKF